MKKLLEIIVLGLMLVGCASSTINYVGFDEIKKIEKKNYMIVGFSGYQRDTDTIHKINEANYTSIEKSINSFCKKKGKNTYVGKDSWNKIRYTYGNGISVLGKKFWCAKSLSEANKLFIDDLKNPSDQNLSTNQKKFQQVSVKFLKQGRPDKIKDHLAKIQGWADLKLYGKIQVKEKLVSAKKPKETTAKTQGASGTAFFVSKNYLITNHHVVKGCNNNSKIIYQTNEIDAKLIAKDKFLDLALLKVDVESDTYISISNQAPSKLQRIIVAGYPFGKYLSDDMKFTSGIISSLKGLGDDSTRLQIDAALNRGNSGGPIVDENTGKLVAVAVAGLRKDKTEAVNFGIKAGSVKNFLESNQIDTTLLKKKYSRAGVANLLENATMYTFCN
ncbi:serine protease [Pelagibacteraceae bacterium]|nr:serine protease [Pelagibacteraceae bacterium]